MIFFLSNWNLLKLETMEFYQTGTALSTWRTGTRLLSHAVLAHGSAVGKALRAVRTPGGAPPPGARDESLPGGGESRNEA